MTTRLYYFHDPMCSWCYAFRPLRKHLQEALSGRLSWVNVLGGLAADEDTLMPAPMRDAIQGHWRRIEQVVPGTRFNYDFWSECEPRRSTWPACRAVIAATLQGKDYEEKMIESIQDAYYRQAKNPSDYSTHHELAAKLGLDTERFASDLVSTDTEEELQAQLRLTSEFGVRGFPSLVLETTKGAYAIEIDYNNEKAMREAIENLLA